MGYWCIASARNSLGRLRQPVSPQPVPWSYGDDNSILLKGCSEDGKKKKFMYLNAGRCSTTIISFVPNSRLLPGRVPIICPLNARLHESS